jgi:integrase
MPTSYAVRFHKNGKYVGARGTTHYVRWQVDTMRFRRGFRTKALAESFRSELVTAARKGEPFDTATGEPVDPTRARTVLSWYAFACSYVDMKWPEAAGKSRTGIADTLATATPALLPIGGGRPGAALIRAALYGWAFNAKRRSSGPPPAELAAAVDWVDKNSRPIGDLSDTDVLRAVVTLLGQKLDGTTAAESVFARKRAVLHNALEFAVESGLLAVNPMAGRKFRRTQPTEQVDRRVVVNPSQAQALLDAVRDQGRHGDSLVAFFALMYYAALRPAEAAALRVVDLDLPADGWGTAHVPGSAPTTGVAWSDSGRRRDQRGLKHRPRSAVRPVPLAPPLVALLRHHVTRHGSPDGRLFRGARGGDLSDSVYGRVWQDARRQALTATEVDSPLARRPYDLRHAAVSTWLNGGVEPTRVAEWAGHSVAVLLRVYAKCLAGQEDTARERVGQALGLKPTGQIPVKG